MQWDLCLHALVSPSAQRGVWEGRPGWASPFPTTSPDTHPRHLDSCVVALAGSRAGLSPTPFSAADDKTQDPEEPFSHQTVQKGLAPCGSSSKRGPCASPQSLCPTLPCVASHCPEGPRPNPLEGAGRSISVLPLHPPTPWCCAAEPLLHPHPNPPGAAGDVVPLLPQHGWS